jgi:RNA polymerase sigma-70 factor (ECF subfamily)
MVNTQADVALIAACQQGDSQAFRQVFILYKDRVYALCRHMAGNAEDAEDLTQETFVSAFQSIGNFRAESTFGTWLYRIASNRCLNRLRQNRSESHSVDVLNETVPPAFALSPEERIVRKELNCRIEAAVASLPEALRLVFVLGTIEGLRYKEIADIANISEEAVKMRIHRARKQVRDRIQKYLEA